MFDARSRGWILGVAVQDRDAFGSARLLRARPLGPYRYAACKRNELASLHLLPPGIDRSMSRI